MKNTLEKKGRCVALWLLLNNKTLSFSAVMCNICLYVWKSPWLTLCGSLGWSGCSWDEHLAASTVKPFLESSSGALCTSGFTFADISNKKRCISGWHNSLINLKKFWRNKKTKMGKVNVFLRRKYSGSCHLPLSSFPSFHCSYLELIIFSYKSIFRIMWFFAQSSPWQLLGGGLWSEWFLIGLEL